MTIEAIVLLIIVSFICLLLAFALLSYNNSLPWVIAIGIVIAMVMGTFLYFNYTESGKRALVDRHSEFSNGIERTINVYTADGDLIATYEGKIDLEDNAGGYVLFDYQGKRYTYYNCFVESIAEID